MEVHVRHPAAYFLIFTPPEITGDGYVIVPIHKTQLTDRQSPWPSSEEDSGCPGVLEAYFTLRFSRMGNQ